MGGSVLCSNLVTHTQNFGIFLKMEGNDKKVPRKIRFVTPTKAQKKKISVTPSKKVVPVYFSSLKTRGIQKLLDYVRIVESENTSLKLREQKIREKFHKCKERRKKDLERFDKSITNMASVILSEQQKHNQIVVDKNKVLRQISEKLIDLQSNLEREKSRIETEMAQKNKIIQRLKQTNESLKEKLNSIEKKNCIFTKLDEDDSSDSGRESDAVTEDDKNSSHSETSRSKNILVEDNETLPQKVVCYLTCYL